MEDIGKNQIESESQLTDLHTGRKGDYFAIRFPDGMKERIKKIAKSKKRTMNAEVVYMLNRALSSSMHDESSADRTVLSSTAEFVAKEFDSLSDLGKVKVMEVILKNARRS